jgi:hypothetical protein
VFGVVRGLAADGTCFLFGGLCVVKGGSESSCHAPPWLRRESSGEAPCSTKQANREGGPPLALLGGGRRGFSLWGGREPLAASMGRRSPQNPLLQCAFVLLRGPRKQVRLGPGPWRRCNEGGCFCSCAAKEPHLVRAAAGRIATRLAGGGDVAPAAPETRNFAREGILQQVCVCPRRVCRRTRKRARAQRPIDRSTKRTAGSSSCSNNQRMKKESIGFESCRRSPKHREGRLRQHRDVTHGPCMMWRRTDPRFSETAVCFTHTNSQP